MLLINVLLRLLRTPAAYASLGVILAALGIELKAELFERIAEALAALAGLIGLIMAALEAA